MAKKKIGNFAAILFKIAFQALGAFVNRITHEPSRLMVEGFRQSAMDVVNALSDTDPEDGAQIQRIINRYVTDSPLEKGLRQTILLNIAKVKNQNLRVILTNLSGPAFKTMDILTDEIKDNGDQLLSMSKEFGQSEKGLETMIAMLETFIDSEAAAVIAQIVADYLRNLWEQDRERAEKTHLTEAAIVSLERNASARMAKLQVA